MRRVPDVLDVWFDSGSMPFAQVHYPFENADWFEHHYPGDFIVEYIGQTRGWFYTLHVLATALFDRPAFRTCVSHGIVLGNDGQKMSKSLRNYPDVSEVFDRDGADAMRWFLMSSPILRGGNLIVTEQGIRDGVRQVLLPLWSSWYFFSLYANASTDGAGYRAQPRADSPALLDRYVLAKTDALVADVTIRMDANDIAGACEAVRGHVDVLTNWYIRRSRQRFWDEDRRLRRPLYEPGDVVPAGGTASAVDNRDDLEGADRWAQRPSDRLAGGLGNHRRHHSGRGGSRDPDGPGPRDQLGRAGVAQGQAAASPAAAGRRNRCRRPARARCRRAHRGAVVDPARRGQRP